MTQMLFFDCVLNVSHFSSVSNYIYDDMCLVHFEADQHEKFRDVRHRRSKFTNLLVFYFNDEDGLMSARVKEVNWTDATIIIMDNKPLELDEHFMPKLEQAAITDNDWFKMVVMLQAAKEGVCKT